MSNDHPAHQSPFGRKKTNRRRFVQGAAGAGIAGVGALAGGSAGLSRMTRTVQAAPATQVVADLPAGMALVVSPRMPLFGVGGADVARLLGASVPSWVEVGAPIDLPVEPIALEGQVPAGMTPVATAATYDDLAAELDRRPGAVALIPVDQVDFRANVLAVEGYDPLRQPAEGDAPLRIGVVGDIVPGRNVHFKMVAYGDYTHPFHKVAAELSSYDLTFANLEGNLSNTIEPPTDTHTFSFVSSPAMLDGFTMAGIDAVSLANNHSTWNSEGWGTSALTDTMAALEAAGVSRFGAGYDLGDARSAWTPEAKGQRIAILGIDGVTANEQARDAGATVYGASLGEDGYAGAADDRPGTNPYIEEQVMADIEALTADYDIVIPYFHCGVEYVAVPPDWAVQGARAAIDAGATMVLTNHPHVIQGMEVYEGRPIVYSVGNFIFDQMFSVEVRTGMILEMVFRGNTVIGLRMRGVEIEDFNQPRLMTAGEQASMMDRFWANSDRMTRE